MVLSEQVPAESPVVERLRMVFDHMTKYISEHGDSRYSFILKTVMDEALDEMADEGPENLESWFEQFGQIVSWIGTGNLDDLPEALRSIIPEPSLNQLVNDGAHS